MIPGSCRAHLTLVLFINSLEVLHICQQRAEAVCFIIIIIIIIIIYLQYLDQPAVIWMHCALRKFIGSS
jgi:hypothetical protein